MSKHNAAPKKAVAQVLAFEKLVQLAWSGQLGLLQLLPQADQLVQQGKPELAAVLYQTWLKRNRTTHDQLAWFNLGVILLNANDVAGAREAYSRAVQLDGNLLQARFNLGLVYERLGHSDAACAQWRHIESHTSLDNPDQRNLQILALNNLGRHLEDRNRYADALAALTRSLQIEPNQPDVIHHWVFQRAKQCAWPVYEALPGVSLEKQIEHTSALAMVSLSEDPQRQLDAALGYVKRKFGNHLPPALAPDSPYQKHKKLRIGYCSGDLCQHPVAMLTVELFELHNRKDFEVFVFDWSREDNSSLRQRIRKAADHFIPIQGMSDNEAAKLIRAKEIDILIDLHGQTLGARIGMLMQRPAPIQITYLGLPATTGLPCIDYVIGDRFLIPEAAQAFYSEKILYMPDVYQVSDRQRVPAEIPSRADCGLPEEGFVFCSFNNNYKISPEVFASWMRILDQVPGSVLWLLADNAWAEQNLRQAAIGHGVDDARLIFAARVPTAQFQARLAVADLFLDTYPFNAGTTCNDALWMGLPVLTYSGQTFASRMAGALLTAAGLPQLITTDLADYERKAVQLAFNPGECQRLREHLQGVKEEGVLFDTPRFVGNLEAEFKRLAGR